MKKWPFVLVLVCAIILIMGCGSFTTNSEAGDSAGRTPEKEIGDTAEKASTAPVKLTMFLGGGDLSDEEFQSYFLQPLKEKHPNITLEFVKQEKGTMIEDLITAGTTPDIIFTSQSKVQEFSDLQLQWDLSALLKKNNIDISNFDPLTIEGVAAKGKVYGLPFSYNFSALFYNKDIFDKFGVPYPKGQMNWDQIIELGKKVSRVDGDVQYEALFPGTLWQFAQQLSVPYTDPGTDEPMFTSDKWKKAAEYYNKIFDIPGNQKATLKDFYGSRTLAMVANVGNSIIGEDLKAIASGSQMNWDIAPYPNFPESAGRSMQMGSQILMITSASKHKEQAFQVVSLVTGKEVQLKMSRSGRNSSLVDKTVINQFGVDSPSLKNKQVKSIYVNTPATPISGRYDVPIRKVVTKETPKLINGEQDANTFLRNLQELAKQEVLKEKGK